MHVWRKKNAIHPYLPPTGIFQSHSCPPKTIYLHFRWQMIVWSIDSDEKETVSPIQIRVLTRMARQSAFFSVHCLTFHSLLLRPPADHTAHTLYTPMPIWDILYVMTIKLCAIHIILIKLLSIKVICEYNTNHAYFELSTGNANGDHVTIHPKLVIFNTHWPLQGLPYPLFCVPYGFVERHQMFIHGVVHKDRECVDWWICLRRLPILGSPLTVKYYYYKTVAHLKNPPAHLPSHRGRPQNPAHRTS